MDVDEAFAVKVGELDLVMRVSRRRLQMDQSGIRAPTATLTADPAALLDVRRAELTTADAVRSGKLGFQGSRAAVTRLRRLFQLT